MKKPLEDISTAKFLAQSIIELENVKKDVNTTVASVEEKVSEKISEIDSTLDQWKEELVSFSEDIVAEIQNLEQIEGKPGKDADHDQVVKDVLAKMPKIDANKLAQAVLKLVPPIDEKALVQKIIAKIPENKASLQVIQEKFETDPMSVISKLKELADSGKFSLKASHIEGLEQQMAALRSQTVKGMGYVHGGGDTVSAGTNITIDAGPNGTKRINATGEATSITDLIEAGMNVTITGTGTIPDPYVINSSGGGGGSPAGSDTQIQVNNMGSFGAFPNFTWDDASQTFTANPTGATSSLLQVNLPTTLSQVTSKIGASNYPGYNGGNNDGIASWFTDPTDSAFDWLSLIAYDGLSQKGTFGRKNSATDDGQYLEATPSSLNLYNRLTGASNGGLSLGNGGNNFQWEDLVTGSIGNVDLTSSQSKMEFASPTDDTQGGFAVSNSVAAVSFLDNGLGTVAQTLYNATSVIGSYTDGAGVTTSSSQNVNNSKLEATDGTGASYVRADVGGSFSIHGDDGNLNSVDAVATISTPEYRITVTDSSSISSTFLDDTQVRSEFQGALGTSARMLLQDATAQIFIDDNAGTTVNTVWGTGIFVDSQDGSGEGVFNINPNTGYMSVTDGTDITDVTVTKNTGQLQTIENNGDIVTGVYTDTQKVQLYTTNASGDISKVVVNQTSVVSQYTAPSSTSISTSTISSSLNQIKFEVGSTITAVSATNGELAMSATDGVDTAQITVNPKTIQRFGGIIDSRVTTVAYGTTTNLTANDYDLEVGTSGTGATTVNLPTGTNAPVGTVYIIGDAGAAGVVNLITVDAGSSNTINGASIAQTITFATVGVGGTLTLKKISSTVWKVQ